MLISTVKKLVVSCALIGTLTSSHCGGCNEYFTTITQQEIPEAQPIFVDNPLKDKILTESNWEETIGSFTPEEAISYFQTPFDPLYGVPPYINYIVSTNPRDNHKNFYSFKQVHQGSPMDCTEGTFAIAALLSDNGYPPIAVVSGYREEKGFTETVHAHLFFLYKINGRFGSAGSTQGDYNEPIFNTIDELIKFKINGDPKVEGYDIINIEQNYPQYINSNEKLPFKHYLLENQIK